VKLGVMPVTIAMLLTCKIGFAATDAVTGLKLVEMGVPKVSSLIYLQYLLRFLTSSSVLCT
jgi:hypothetical protein